MPHLEESMAFYIDLPITIRSWRNNNCSSNRLINVPRHIYDIKTVNTNYRMDKRLYTRNNTVSDLVYWGTNDWSSTSKQLNTPPEFLYIIKCFNDAFGNGQISLNVKFGKTAFVPSIFSHSSIKNSNELFLKIYSVE